MRIHKPVCTCPLCCPEKWALDAAANGREIVQLSGKQRAALDVAFRKGIEIVDEDQSGSEPESRGEKHGS